MLSVYSDTVGTVVHVTGGMLMSITSRFSRLTRVVQGIQNWEEEDAMRLYAYLADFLDATEPIIDKYDMEKPKKFIFRRLDELDT